MNELFRDRRYPTVLDLTVVTPQGRRQATLIDVNQRGARLDGMDQVMRGERISLVVMNETVPGIVRWAIGRRIGVSFLMPARPALVDLLRLGMKATAAGQFHTNNLREMR